MAHKASDGSMWTNAAQARSRSVAVPGKAQGDGKQPVDSFSKPEAPRAPVAGDSDSGSGKDTQAAPQVEVSQDPSGMFVVTAKFASADEAHAAAQAMSGSDDAPSGNPAQAMM
jgi:hypothetical protein